MLRMNVLFMRRTHVISDPLIPAFEQIRRGPLRITLRLPSEMHNRERHGPIFHFEKHVIALHPNCNRLCS